MNVHTSPDTKSPVHTVPFLRKKGKENVRFVNRLRYSAQNGGFANAFQTGKFTSKVVFENAVDKRESTKTDINKNVITTTTTTTTSILVACQIQR